MYLAGLACCNIVAQYSTIFKGLKWLIPPLPFDVIYTVEPLTHDHPHQRPSLSYDHISCDGQGIMCVYESLTSDHPSYTTTPM